jgi:tRNA nucleotidyltransferase (CCA-adding enzyme)
MVARFNLSVAPETVKICAEQDLSELAVERFDEEFKKLWLKSLKPSLGLRWISKMGLQRFFPEFICENKEAQESLYILADKIAALSQELPEKERTVWAWASLGSIIGLESLTSLLARFTKDKKMIDAVLLRRGALSEMESLDLDTLKEGQVRRLAISYPIQERILLARASFEALGGKWAEFELGQKIENDSKELKCYTECPVAWLQGRDLMKLGMKPSKEMGVILKAVFEKQLDGDFESMEAAKAWVTVEYKEMIAS